jgi:hypothetical protein
MKHCAPPRWLEVLIAPLVPPACREEVLGDLHERCTGPAGYLDDVLHTLPLVITGRIRRTTAPRMALMEACVLYLSYAGAVRYGDPALLNGQWGLLRAAIPAGFALLGMVLADAYAVPRTRSACMALRGPLVGVAAAWLSHAVLAAGRSALGLPAWILVYGSAAALPYLAAVRMLGPPVAGAKPRR